MVTHFINEYVRQWARLVAETSVQTVLIFGEENESHVKSVVFVHERSNRPTSTNIYISIMEWGLINDFFKIRQLIYLYARQINFTDAW